MWILEPPIVAPGAIDVAGVGVPVLVIAALVWCYRASATRQNAETALKAC